MQAVPVAQGAMFERWPPGLCEVMKADWTESQKKSDRRESQKKSDREEFQTGDFRESQTREKLRPEKVKFVVFRMSKIR